MKFTVKYICILILLITTNYSFAQRPVSQGNGSPGNQNIETLKEQQTPLAMWTYWSKKSTDNTKYNFTVTMLNGVKKQVNSKLYTDKYLHKSYLYFVDESLSKADTNREQTIYPEQTIEISLNVLPASDHASASTAPHYLTGIATDSCWMLKVIDGNICGYAVLKQENGKLFDPEKIAAIQQKNGPIIQCDQKNLIEMIGDDDDAVESAQWKHYRQAIKIYNRNSKKK